MPPADADAPPRYARRMNRREVLGSIAGTAVLASTTLGHAQAKKAPAPTPTTPVAPGSNTVVPLAFNPAKLNGLGVEISMAGDAIAYQGEIYDLGGRRVRTFATLNGRAFWDGRDDRGELVRPGIYFVRVQSGAREGFSRVALVR